MRFGAWLNGFCSMAWIGLWSLTTSTGRPNVYWWKRSNPNKTTKASFSICAQLRSAGVRAREANSMGLPSGAQPGFF